MTPRYSIHTSCDRDWLTQTVSDLEDAGWTVDTWLTPYMDTSGDLPGGEICFGVVMKRPPDPHPYAEHYVAPGGAKVPRTALLVHVGRLIDDAKARSLPIPDTTPEGSLETVGNEALYQAGVALKKRIAAHDTLQGAEPEVTGSVEFQRSSAQMLGA